MDLNALTDILNNLSEKLSSSASEGDSSSEKKRNLLLKKFCRTSSDAVDTISKDEDFSRLVTGLLVISAFMIKNIQKLKRTASFIAVCVKLFRQCAAAVLNVKWQGLHEENDLLKQNFLHTLENLHSQLVPFNFLKFDQIKKLSENAWTHPTLIKIMRGDTTGCDQQEVLSYILNEDAIILQLRVDMMVAESCEEYALNLCKSFRSHPKFCQDSHMRSVLLSLLYKLGQDDRLQEECQKLSFVDAVHVIKYQMDKRPQTASNREMCTVIIQTCLVQNWIKKSRHEGKKELLSLWIKHLSLADNNDKFIENVWAIAKLSQSTQQIVTFIDVLREECGNNLLQLYIDMCVFALNVDKGQLERSIKAGDQETAASRRLDIASVCVKLSCLCRHISNKISRICALTNFAMTLSEWSFNQIKAVYDKSSGCCCTMCQDQQDSHEPGTVNPATLLEVERLLNMFLPDYLSPDLEYTNIQVQCHKYVQDTLQVLTNMHKQSLKKKSVTDASKSDGQGELFTPDYIPLSVILTQSFDAQDERRMELLLKITRPDSGTKAKASQQIHTAQNQKTGTAQVQITQNQTANTMQAAQSQTANTTNTTKSHTTQSQAANTAMAHTTLGKTAKTTKAHTTLIQTTHATVAYTTLSQTAITTVADTTLTQAANTTKVNATHSQTADSTDTHTTQGQASNTTKTHATMSQTAKSTKIQATQSQTEKTTRVYSILNQDLVTRSKIKAAISTKVLTQQSQKANSTKVHTSTSQNQQMDTTQVQTTQNQTATTHKEMATSKPQTTNLAKALPAKNQAANTTKAHAGALEINTTNEYSHIKQDQTANTGQAQASTSNNQTADAEFANMKLVSTSPSDGQTASTVKILKVKYPATNALRLLAPKCESKASNVKIIYLARSPARKSNKMTVKQASQISANLQKLFLNQSLPIKETLPQTSQNPTTVHPDTMQLPESTYSVNTNPPVVTTTPTSQKAVTKIYKKVSLIKPPLNDDPNSAMQTSPTLNTPKDIKTLLDKVLQDAPTNIQDILLTPASCIGPDKLYDVTLVQTQGGPAIKLHNLTLTETSQFLNKSMKNINIKHMTPLGSTSGQCTESPLLDLDKPQPVINLQIPARSLLAGPRIQTSQQLTSNLDGPPLTQTSPQNPANNLNVIWQTQPVNKAAAQPTKVIYVKQSLKPSSNSTNFSPAEATSSATQTQNTTVVPHSISVRKLFQQPAFPATVQGTQQPSASHKTTSQAQSSLLHPTSLLLNVKQTQVSPLKTSNTLQGSQSASSAGETQSKFYSTPTISQVLRPQPGVAINASTKMPSQSSNTIKKQDPRVEGEDNEESPEAQSGSVPQNQLSKKQQELQEKKLIAGMLKATLQQDYDTLSQLAESAGSEVIATVLRILKTAVPGISASTHANKEKGNIDSVPSTQQILESSLKARTRPPAHASSHTANTGSTTQPGSRLGSCKISTKHQEGPVLKSGSTPQRGRPVSKNQKPSPIQGQQEMSSIQLTALKKQPQLQKPTTPLVSPTPVLKSLLNHQATPSSDHQLYTKQSAQQGQLQILVVHPAASNEQNQIKTEKQSFPWELSQTTSENSSDSSKKSDRDSAADVMRHLVHQVGSPSVLNVCLPEQAAVSSVPASALSAEETAMQKKTEILGKSYFEDVKHLLQTPVLQQSNVPLIQEFLPVYSQEPVMEPEPVMLSKQGEHCVSKLVSASAIAPVNILPSQLVAQSKDPHKFMGFLQLSHQEDGSIAKNSQGLPQLRFVPVAACLPNVSGSKQLTQIIQSGSITLAGPKSLSLPRSSPPTQTTTVLLNPTVSQPGPAVSVRYLPSKHPEILLTAASGIDIVTPSSATDRSSDSSVQQGSSVAQGDVRQTVPADMNKIKRKHTRLQKPRVSQVVTPSVQRNEHEQPEDVALHRCTMCKVVFKTLESLNQHIRSVKLETEELNTIDLETTVYQCVYCNRLCVSQAGVDKHRVQCKNSPGFLKQNAENLSKGKADLLPGSSDPKQEEVMNCVSHYIDAIIKKNEAIRQNGIKHRKRSHNLQQIPSNTTQQLSGDKTSHPAAATDGCNDERSVIEKLLKQSNLERIKRLKATGQSDVVVLPETNPEICQEDDETTQDAQEAGQHLTDSSTSLDPQDRILSSAVSYSRSLNSLKNFLTHRKVSSKDCDLLPDKQKPADQAQSDDEEEENDDNLVIDLTTSDSDSGESHQDVLRAGLGSCNKENDKIGASKSAGAVTSPKIVEIKSSKLKSRASKRKQPAAVNTECPTKKNRPSKLPYQTRSASVANETVKLVEAEQEVVDVISVSDEESSSVQPTVHPTVKATVNLTNNNTAKSFPCPFCDIAFKFEYQYLQHEVNCHLNVYFTTTQADKVHFNCRLCERLFSSFPLFKEHLHIHSDTIQEMVQDLVAKMQSASTPEAS